MKYLVIGAGPAGLAFSNRLLQAGIDDFLVLEAEKEAGGLCRSQYVDGSPLDIGGGHFLDVRRPEVNAFLFQFLPQEEWNIFDRDSRIAVHDRVIHHPFEANIWELSIDQQVSYLKDIAAAGCNTGIEMPGQFIAWITWKLGRKIAENYMIPYNQKVFGESLGELGTYWLEKLPDVSFEDTLRSCLEQRAYAKQPGHARFYYPKKYGYGELWLRMAEALGNRIAYRKKVCSLNCNEHVVLTESGEKYQADVIITTIPWAEYSELAGMPDEMRNSVYELRHSSVQIDYYSENMDTGAHWIYYPAKNLSYHRILIRHNFCYGSRGYWTETNPDRTALSGRKSSFRYVNQYAYPLNTISKPQIMRNVLWWCRSHNIYGLGRWGEHQHYNSDATVERAVHMADQLSVQHA